MARGGGLGGCGDCIRATRDGGLAFNHGVLRLDVGARTDGLVTCDASNTDSERRPDRAFG
jgi:hypothetical protein